MGAERARGPGRPARARPERRAAAACGFRCRRAAATRSPPAERQQERVQREPCGALPSRRCRGHGNKPTTARSALVRRMSPTILPPMLRLAGVLAVLLSTAACGLFRSAADAPRTLTRA